MDSQLLPVINRTALSCHFGKVAPAILTFKLKSRWTIEFLGLGGVFIAAKASFSSTKEQF